MKPAFKLRPIAVGGVLLLAAFGSTAMSLGRIRGAVVVGQPLELAVPLHFESGEDSSSACAEAEVFHADSRVEASRVKVSVEPGPTPEDFFIRVKSSAVVDEPMVTLYVRSGCSQRVTRRYVVLSDVPSEQPQVTVAAPVKVPVPATPAAPVAPAPTPAPTLSSSTSPRMAAAELPPPAATKSSVDAPVRRPKAVSRPAAPKVPKTEVAAKAVPSNGSGSSVAGKPRLKLDPVEIPASKDPGLKGSRQLSSQPDEANGKRAEAAAMWRALNTQPEDLVKDSQRLKGLEADIKALRDVTNKNQAELAKVNEALARAQEERYNNPLVWGLSALLLAVLAGAGYSWRRGGAVASSGKDWWKESRSASLASAAPSKQADLASMDDVPDSTPQAVTDVDVDLDPDESVFESLKTRVLVPPPVYEAMPTIPKQQDFSMSLSSVVREVNTEELFDIQQQADFFVSLGQFDQAVELLTSHIAENPETSALAYLDLFQIYHSLGREEDYSALRKDFNRVFNAEVPEFAAFTENSRGLEAYPRALADIVALWTTPKVLEVLEESIFRKPGEGAGEAFDLEAYRELVLLYSIAKHVFGRSTSMSYIERMRSGEAAGGANAGHAFVRPLSASTEPSAEYAAVAAELAPVSTAGLGLDIDLSEPISEMEPVSAYFDLDSGPLSVVSPAPVQEPAEPEAAPMIDLPLAVEPEPAPAAPNSMLEFDLVDSFFDSFDKDKANKDNKGS